MRSNIEQIPGPPGSPPYSCLVVWRAVVVWTFARWLEQRQGAG